MVDLVSIGVSGLGAYQRALATTSNNIANLQTEGYVRQRAVLESAGQDNLSRVSLGNGVRFTEVQRLYDRFAEENLQRASSSLKGEEALLKELQSLQDSIGSSEAGLHGAFQAFFDAARDLEAAPASPGSRAGFLAAAEGLSARVRGLGGAVDTLDGTTRTQVDQAVGEINTLLGEVAALNIQLVKRASDSEQPMQLLDRRDAALKSLSERLGITVELGQSGAATVFAGESASGAALVENNRARSLSVSFDPYDFGKAEFVLDAASQPVVLAGIRAGTLGGLVNFRAQALGPTADKLDELALAFGREVNKLHRQGLDSLGRPGQDIFYVGPDFSVDGRANSGSSRLGVEVVESDLVDARSYEMRFDATRQLWALRDLKTGTTVYGQNELLLGGLKFSVQGAPRDGDTYRISPESRPAQTFRTLIKEGAEVASAAKLTTKASLGNYGTAAADIGLTEPRVAEAFRSLEEVLPKSVRIAEQSFVSNLQEHTDTLIAASAAPIAVIPAGYAKVDLSTSKAGGELAIFTRDGRQLSGPAVGAEIVKAANGFYQGATYSDAYRNKSGSLGYLSQNFIFGAHQESGSQIESYLEEVVISGVPTTQLATREVLTPATIVSESIVGDDVELGNTFNLSINGKTVTVEVPGEAELDELEIQTKLDALAFAINEHKSTTGVVVETSADGRLIFKSDQQISVAASSLNDASYLTIGGYKFVVDAAEFEEGQSPAEYLSKLINETKSGLSASASNDELVITNAAGNTGEPIVIGDNNVGLDERPYFNPAALSISVPPTESPSILAKLGLRAGFVMNAPLAEDLLVFGVNSQGFAAPVYLSGSYQVGAPSSTLAPDSRQYTLRFEGQSYKLLDELTGTEVSAGIFNTTTRSVEYGSWRVTLSGIPADQDEFTILPTDEPMGDNRIAAALANLQGSRTMLDSKQTVQQEYENLVNRIGAITVQAEIAKDAQQVVFDHARESRDRVSGVNLDEELADLLRFQQAYQANAQVVQVANRLFDSLLQRL